MRSRIAVGMTVLAFALAGSHRQALAVETGNPCAARQDASPRAENTRPPEAGACRDAMRHLDECLAFVNQFGQDTSAADATDAQARAAFMDKAKGIRAAAAGGRARARAAREVCPQTPEAWMTLSLYDTKFRTYERLYREREE
jgi:hypothetical protein